ncbi:MAG: transposase [Gammaproteobacteria bacterium]|nr:transposase [Gammaproteobacteria bacterium]
MIKDDIRQFLFDYYQADFITASEIDLIIKQIESLPASDLYDSKKTFCKWLSDGFLLNHEDYRWDKIGFCLWYKRFEKAKFKWPRKMSGRTITLTEQQWALLLNGLDINLMKGHQPLHFGSII